MSIVAERRKQLAQQFGLQSASRGREQQSTPHGTVTDASFLTTPIHGNLQGENVRILAHGNVEGFSPGYLIADEAGDTLWVPTDQVTITDPNYLPMRR